MLNEEMNEEVENEAFAPVAADSSAQDDANENVILSEQGESKNLDAEDKNMQTEGVGTFDEVKARLDEIVELVSDDSLPLEEALSLYEEAVALGLQASNKLEADIALSNAAMDSAEEAAQQQEQEIDPSTLVAGAPSAQDDTETETGDPSPVSEQEQAE